MADEAVERLREFEARPEVRVAFARLHQMDCSVDSALRAFAEVPQFLAEKSGNG